MILQRFTVFTVMVLLSLNLAGHLKGNSGISVENRSTIIILLFSIICIWEDYGLACTTICFSKTILMHDVVVGLLIDRYEFGVLV